MLQMPRVQQCTVTECGYNDGGCHAFAITVGGDLEPGCNTFVETSEKGGLAEATAQVGACTRSDCRYNQDLECRAPQIRVGPGQDPADCLTFQLR